MKTVFTRYLLGALLVLLATGCDFVLPDLQKPVITLQGEPSVTLMVGDSYTDAGATALDNKDGDITADIVVDNPVDTGKAGTYTITYNVSDAAGNQADEVTRTVMVKPAEDKIKPVIALQGSAEVNLTVGDIYIDAGATANDNKDGDITENIVVTGSVDTSTTGTYTLTYNVHDDAGNTADVVTRVVTVNEVPNTRLKVTVVKSAGGMSLQSIKDNSTELLNQVVDLFHLSIQNTDNNKSMAIGASSGWQDVEIVSEGANQVITLSNPSNHLLPSSLKSIVTISTENNQSTWDMSVDGLGEHYTLMEVEFPKLNIKSSGEDNFFLPYQFGRVIYNPAAGIDFHGNGLYPRGFGATMQYLAYYNTNYGLYFGFHDPKAALKEFKVNNENGGVSLECRIPIPDKTRADNNWEMPGEFVLNTYRGDWYDAARIYKNWVYKNAEYKPVDTPNRIARQAKAGAIAVWAKDDIYQKNIASVEQYVRDFKAFMDVPVGVEWIGWYDKPHDTDFPEIFPEAEGLGGVISRLQNTYGSDLFISAYMNGRLYDSNLASYGNEGWKGAAKDSAGRPYRYNSTSSLRIMCPTQERWQNIMVDSAKQIVSRLGMNAVYIDQVTAAAPKECMDRTHHHTLGGGSYWRDGYKNMFKKIHETIPSGKFIMSEGANDFLVDEVDAFLAEVFVVEGQVPAFQAVYGGKVQFVGPSVGASAYAANEEPDSQLFYGRLAQSFGFGVIPGRFYMTIVMHPNARKQRAAEYLRRLARMRFKLKDFLSFGEMKKPLALKGDIPNISFSGTSEAKGTVTIPAIQTSTWSDGESIVVTVINAKVPDGNSRPIVFSFDFDATTYGMSGAIQIKEITESSDSNYEAITPQFTKQVTLESYEVKAFIITPN